MNIAYEFSKIKDGFVKVKDDMNFLTHKISENYDDFMNHHLKLKKEIDSLSDDIFFQIKELKEKIKFHQNGDKMGDSELINLKNEIKELKEEIIKIQNSHNNIFTTIEDIKDNKNKNYENLTVYENLDKDFKIKEKEIKEQSKELKKIQDKLHSSELEIFLLKEKMNEKDSEIKKIKDVNKKIFSILDELSKAEIDILNLQNKN